MVKRIATLIDYDVYRGVPAVALGDKLQILVAANVMVEVEKKNVVYDHIGKKMFIKKGSARVFHLKRGKKKREVIIHEGTTV